MTSSRCLKVHEYFQGVSDETLQEVVRHARVAHHPAGSVVHEADVVLTTVGFVLRGRLKAVRVDARGTESLFRMIGRGEQFGHDGRRPRRTGADPRRRAGAHDGPQPGLRAGDGADVRPAGPAPPVAEDLRRRACGSCSSATAPKRAPMMLALIHDSPATRRTAERLIQRLCDVGEQLAVFSDSDQWQGSPNVRFRPLHVDGRDLKLEEIRRQVAEWQDANRIIFDVHAYLTPERAAQLMELVDRAVYFVPADAADAAHPPPAGDRRVGPRLARQDQRRLVA